MDGGACKGMACCAGFGAQAVPLYHPRPGCVVLMFPDASDFHWGSFFAQVPEEEFRSGVALENM